MEDVVRYAEMPITDLYFAEVRVTVSLPRPLGRGSQSSLTSALKLDDRMLQDLRPLDYGRLEIEYPDELRRKIVVQDILRKRERVVKMISEQIAQHLERAIEDEGEASNRETRP